MNYDCILTDPPWPVENNRGTKAGIPGKAYATMDLREIAAKLENIATALPLHGFICLVAPWEYATWSWDFLFGSETFLTKRKPAVWDKCNPGLGYGFRRGFEMIMLWTGPKWKPRSSLPGVLPVPRGHDRYATSKPILLWTYILEAFAAPGWTVYDPFAGGGSVGDAARLLGIEPILEDVST